MSYAVLDRWRSFPDDSHHKTREQRRTEAEERNGNTQHLLPCGCFSSLPSNVHNERAHAGAS